jgi:hypothetical protein
MTQLYIGIIAEGSTDYRFLIPIVKKALVDIVFDCQGQVDILDVKVIGCDKGESFTDYVLNASRKGNQDGILMLIVHTDADGATSEKAYEHKIIPAKALLEEKSENTHCKNLVALVPVHETEAWMLADKSVFIKSIGTKKNEKDLNIHGNPESFSNPKERIENAIRTGRADMPRKLRNNLSISDLYSYLGQAIQIESLKTLRSYADFENNVREVLNRLHLLPAQT